MNDETARRALEAWKALRRIAKKPECDAAGIKILADLREARHYYRRQSPLLPDEERIAGQIESILVRHEIDPC